MQIVHFLVLLKIKVFKKHQAFSFAFFRVNM